jgi:hypothetical protein
VTPLVDSSEVASSKEEVIEPPKEELLEVKHDLLPKESKRKSKRGSSMNISRPALSDPTERQRKSWSIRNSRDKAEMDKVWTEEKVEVVIHQEVRDTEEMEEEDKALTRSKSADMGKVWNLPDCIGDSSDQKNEIVLEIL